MDHRIVDARDGASLHVAATGSGPDVVVLSGGPGCVHYLADEKLAPRGFRAWFPDPRGVGRSGGGGHDMATAVADLEDIREALGLEKWLVLGHSWGSDLAVRYALDRPDRVSGVIGLCGHGLHRDRDWAAEYHRLEHTEDAFEIDYVPQVHDSLGASFREWIHEPDLFRRLADSPVPMHFVAAADDIRPSWPLRQLAELVPSARFSEVPGAVHNFWSTDPELWVRTVTSACAELVGVATAQDAKG